MDSAQENARKQLLSAIRSKRTQLPEAAALAESILKGNRLALAEAITLIESDRDADQRLAEDVLHWIQPQTGNSRRIGISGVPGAGKSTFIEAFGTFLCNQGKKLAVLAVDPSSELGKGSILGDKTRMHQLAAHPNAFIRPSPSSGNLGGVARRTREVIHLCEAAGFTDVWVETVGVGQNETAVHAMTDLFVLLSVAGTGDELQGIKRGITEMADIVLVNKADGAALAASKAAAFDLRRAFHFMPQKPSAWNASVLLVSALEKTGLTEVETEIQRYFEWIDARAYRDHRRKEQARLWFETLLKEEVWNAFLRKSEAIKQFETLQRAVELGEMTVQQAVRAMLENTFNR